jgi:hypothetical protein
MAGKGGADLLPVIAPAVRRLPRALAAPSDEQAYLLRWSVWRRRKQAATRRSHYNRRPRRNLRL